MVHTLYLCLVVVFRAIGFCSAGTALIGIVLGLIVSGRGAPIGIWFSATPMLLGGILLWFVAKPAARLITSGLDD